jgi:hypothetical protein
MPDVGMISTKGFRIVLLLRKSAAGTPPIAAARRGIAFDE